MINIDTPIIELGNNLYLLELSKAKIECLGYNSNKRIFQLYNKMHKIDNLTPVNDNLFGVNIFSKPFNESGFCKLILYKDKDILGKDCIINKYGDILYTSKFSGDLFLKGCVCIDTKIGKGNLRIFQKGGKVFNPNIEFYFNSHLETSNYLIIPTLGINKKVYVINTKTAQYKILE